MKSSQLTSFLKKSVEFLQEMRTPSIIIAPLKLLYFVLYKLETNGRLWKWASRYWEAIIALVLSTLMLVITTKISPAISLATQIAMILILAPLPLWRGIRVVKRNPEQTLRTLIANTLVTFIAYEVAYYLAFRVLIWLDPSPGNLSFLAELPVYVFRLSPALMSNAVAFGGVYPFVLMLLYRNIDATNLQNRVARLEQ